MSFSEVQDPLDLGHSIFTSLRNLWTFNEGSGSTAADSQGANTGTLGTGITWNGSFLNFTAAGQVALASNETITVAGDFSIAWRCQPSATSSAKMVWGDNSNTTDYGWFNSATGFRLVYGDTVNFTTAASRDQMRSYVLTAEDLGTGLTRFRLYEDGTEVAGGYVDKSNATYDLIINAIGNGYTGTSFAYDGDISWMGIWDRTLSSAEAALLIPGGLAPSDTITITSPTDYTTRQRDGSNQGTFTLAGTYTGTPTTIEYRFNGGSWATLDASPSGGTFSEPVTLTGPAQGDLEVRFSNDTGVTDSVSYITVCDVYVCLIDSICSGRATNNQTYSHASLRPTQYTIADGWIEGKDDAVAAKTGGDVGTYWPHFATRYMARTGNPVAYINLGVGGMKVDGRTSANYSGSITASGAGGIAGVLSNGGANDLSLVDLTQAQFNADVDALADSFQTNYSVTTQFDVLGKVTSPGTATEHANVQKAVLEAVSDNANVTLGAILYDIDNDGIHYKTDAAHQEVGRRIDAALAGATSPSVSTITYADGGTEITVTFDANLKTGRSLSANCWEVLDDGTPVTVSSVADGGSATQVVLTCGSALSGTITVSLGKGQDATGVAPAGEDLTLTGQPTLNLPAMPFYDVAATDTTDSTAPVLASAVIPSGGTTLAMTFTEADSPPLLPQTAITGFSITASGGAVSIVATQRTSNTVITLALSRVIESGETVTVSYSSGNVTDSATSPNSLADFADSAVTNSSSVTIGGGGTYPTESQVLQGVTFGPNDTDYTGNVVLPAVGDVEESVAFGPSSASTGTLVVPNENLVYVGTGFGAGGTELTGTMILPGEANVRSGVNYGGSGAATGTLAVPTAAQVLNGVAVDATTGTVVLPAVGDVQSGVTFGAASGSTGTLTLPTEAQVESGVGFGAGGTEFTGTLEATSVSDAPQSTVQFVCVDPTGTLEEGVEVHMQMITVPSGDVGYFYDSTVQTELSNAGGIVQLTGIRGATYKIWRGDSEIKYQVTLDDDGLTTPGSLIGNP